MTMNFSDFNWTTTIHGNNNLSLTMEEEALVEGAKDEILYCQHSHDLTFSPLQAVSRIYIIPVVCAFGTIANTVNICVFSHKQMRNQLVNWFLLALAISDLMMFLATFFVFSVPVIAEQSEDISLVNISPPLLVFFYPIAHVAHTCAVYLTILVSVHRYLGICHPFLVQRSGDSRSVRVAITGAVVFSLFFNLPRCFELQSVPCQSETFHCTSKMVRPTMLMLNQTVAIIYRIILYMIVMFLLPFTTLTIVNWKIVKTLRFSTLLRRRLSYSDQPCKKPPPSVARLRSYSTQTVCAKATHITIHKGGGGGVVDKTDKKEEAITIMLVLLVTQFLVYNSIAFTNNILEQISPAESNSFHFQLLVELSTIFANLNGATTIVYYLILGSKYRIVCKQMARKLACLFTWHLFLSPDNDCSKQGGTSVVKSYNECTVNRSQSLQTTLATEVMLTPKKIPV